MSADLRVKADGSYRCCLHVASLIDAAHPVSVRQHIAKGLNPVVSSPFPPPFDDLLRPQITLVSENLNQYLIKVAIKMCPAPSGAGSGTLNLIQG